MSLDLIGTLELLWDEELRNALAGQQVSGDVQRRAGTGRRMGGTVWHPADLPEGATTRRCREGCARSTGCDTTPSVQDQRLFARRQKGAGSRGESHPRLPDRGFTIIGTPVVRAET